MNSKHLLSILALCLMVSCASKQEKKLEKEIADVPAVSSYEQIEKSVEKNIENSTNLTPEQKTALLALHTETQASIKKYREDSLKLHQILATEIGKADYSQKKVDLIKKRLTKANKERLKITFKAIDKANKILGRSKLADRSEIMSDLYNSHAVNIND
ncbi:MAG: hypothetical protein ACOYL6_05975 [Bacteriovoracaceae bacterium]